MPQDINDQLERLRSNDDHLYRVILGDPSSGQAGLRQNIEDIKANTEQIQLAIQRLTLGYGLLAGVLIMVILQSIYAGMK